MGETVTGATGVIQIYIRLEYQMLSLYSGMQIRAVIIYHNALM